MLKSKQNIEREDFPLKKILSLVLVLCFVLSGVTAFAFDDMPSDWSTTALTHAVENGLLSGYNNKLTPSEPLTRAQMATILVRAFGATDKGDITSFTDVSSGSWYYDAMAISYKMGIFKGDGAGKLNPDAYITRQEAFLVLSRAFALTNADASSLTKFSDASSVATWAKDGISAMVASGYVGGSNGKLNPLAQISRKEFAQVMYNLVKAYCDTTADKIADAEGNVVIRGEITSLKNITVNGDLVIGEGVDSGFTFTNVTVKGRVIIRAVGDFAFDGTASEIVIASDDTEVTVSANSSCGKLTVLNPDASSFNVLGDNVVTPDNPPSNPPVEEDVWTNFH